jgi:hypothetical protein
MRHLSMPLTWLGFSLALAGRLLGQQPADDPQRRTLVGLKNFAVYARVQLSQGATLPAVDESPLRDKLEEAVRREGLSIVSRNDVRDGPGAHLTLLYMVIETRDGAGQETGFAAMSCIQAEQTVSITRLGRYVYAVVPTWKSCGIVAGDTASYARIIDRNADQQIVRFREAWRSVNTRRSAPPDRMSRGGPGPDRPCRPQAGPHGLGSSRVASRGSCRVILGQLSGEELAADRGGNQRLDPHLRGWI